MGKDRTVKETGCLPCLEHMVSCDKSSNMVCIYTNQGRTYIVGMSIADTVPQQVLLDEGLFGFSKNTCSHFQFIQIYIKKSEKRTMFPVWVDIGVNRTVRTSMYMPITSKLSKHCCLIIKVDKTALSHFLCIFL